MRGLRLTVPRSKLLSVAGEYTLDQVSLKLKRGDFAFVYMEAEGGEYRILPSRQVVRLAQDPDANPTQIRMDQLTGEFVEVEDAPSPSAAERLLESATTGIVILVGKAIGRTNQILISENLVANPDWSAAAASAQAAFGDLPHQGSVFGDLPHQGDSFGNQQGGPDDDNGGDDGDDGDAPVVLCVRCENPQTPHFFTVEQASNYKRLCPKCGYALAKKTRAEECTPPDASAAAGDEPEN